MVHSKNFLEKMTIKSNFLIAICCFIFVSCGKSSFYDEYVSLGSSWDENTEVNFSFEAPDTTSYFNMFIQLRNNRNYGFSNVFLIVKTEAPDQTTIIDTLEYAMTKPDGTFLGTGFSDLKENKLFFREKVRFDQLGEYQIGIRHAVRRIGAIEGVGRLEGVTDVGFKIEKIEN